MAKPKIRFQGYTEDWEQRKLGDVIEKLIGGVSIAPDDYVDIGYRTIPKGAVNSSGVADLSGSKNVPEDFFKKNISSKTSTGELVTSLRDLVPTAPNMGRIVRIYGDSEDFLMPQGVYSIIVKKKVSEDYLITYSNSPEYRKIIMAKKNGSTQVHIRNGEFLNIDIPLPSYKEQREIGEYFMNLDHLITLHQRKCDETKKLKKIMLQKMFPKDGEKVPEIRFEGFTEDWEQRKLGELGEIMTGSTPSTSKSEYYSEDGIPWVTPTDINSQTISDTPRKLSEEGIKVGRVVPANTILCTCIASIGKNTLLTVKGSFNQQINCLTPNEYNDAYFLLTESEIWSNIMKRMAAAGTMQIVNKTEFSELTTMIPKLEEQKKIGQYFLTLDHLITLHQRKCDKLQEIKKYMLQNMFI